MEEYPKYNELQTPITEKLLEHLDSKSKTDFFNYLTEIEFLRALTSSNRQRAKDRPKDKLGRVIVDLENPHRLENMSYFTERADYFREHGVYTHIYPNEAPGSEYKKFWDEERRRCKEGYIRESDGEWVTGYHYFYLNYSPILKVEEKEQEASEELVRAVVDELEIEGVRSERVEDFPDVWDGDYIFFHYVERAESQGKHGNLLKSRGMGLSFKFGSMMDRNYFMYRSSKSYAFASETEYLIRDGVLTKAWATMNFIDNHTPFTQAREYKDTEMHKKASYRDIENKTEKGFMSEVIGVTCKNDPDKGRGKRGKLLAFDESGSFTGLKKVWAVARKSVEQGRYVYGFMCAGGTGGEVGSDFEAAEAFTYQPDAYNILSMRNVFDLSAVGGRSSLFIAGYMNREGCYDKDGNSDVIKALVEIMYQRQLVRLNSNDPNDLVREKAEVPITIQEAVLRVEGSLFPAQDLKDYLSEISVNLRKFTSGHYIGRLSYNSEGKVSFVYSEQSQPIRDYPLKDNLDKAGAIEIFELPRALPNGYIDKYRYIAGCLLPGEKVMTDIGLMNVEDVTPSRKLINQDGELVDINKLFRHEKVNSDVYTIKVSNTYRQTTFTEEHPLLTCTAKLNYHNTRTCKKYNIPQRERSYNFEYKEVKNISVGDYIKVPNIYKKENTNVENLWVDSCRTDRTVKNPLLEKDFWWFIGLWLGDGYSRKHITSISFNSKESGYIDKCSDVIKNTFNRSPQHRTRDGSTEVYFSNLELSNFLTEHFGKYAVGKRIPEWVKYLPKDLKLELVHGYLSSDGCTRYVRKYKKASIEFVSINLELLESMQDILFSLGVISSLQKLRDAKEDVYINGRETKSKETYSLRTAHNNSLVLRDLINSENCYKLNKLKDVEYSLQQEKSKLDCFFDSTQDYIYFKIKGIEKNSYTGTVYNFECDTHTYMCHHITTHNCDPIDDDHSTTNSLGSIFIFDRYTDRIVAEYTGRPNTANEFYEICLRLLKFYNARANYENDKKGLYGYFYNKNALYHLVQNPEILGEKDLAKIANNYGNKKYGTNSGVRINEWGRRLQADWLIENAYGTGGENEDGVEIPPLMNLQQLRSIGYIKELIAWHPDINADRISAMGMLMILREDMKRMEIRSSGTKTREVFSDPFFKRTGRVKSQIGYSVLN